MATVFPGAATRPIIHHVGEAWSNQLCVSLSEFSAICGTAESCLRERVRRHVYPYLDLRRRTLGTGAMRFFAIDAHAVKEQAKQEVDQRDLIHRLFLDRQLLVAEECAASVAISTKAVERLLDCRDLPHNVETGRRLIFARTWRAFLLSRYRPTRWQRIDPRDEHLIERCGIPLTTGDHR